MVLARLTTPDKKRYTGSKVYRTYLVSSAEFEGYVLTNSRSSPVWPRLVALFLTKLRPLLPFCNRVVNELLLQRAFYTASDLERLVRPGASWITQRLKAYFNFLPLIIDGILYYRTNAILIDSILYCAKILGTLV